ncbi:MAG: TIGR03619 family F420-dependent LLM class oxidoreductase [SAR202 cluster bacterium]|nr:TIGR03619 family F420-dependent LLM class oxidoreductase [SAR202 cluster bacterium]
MSIGIIIPLPAYHLDPAFLAEKAENLGFDSIWCGEHPILPVHSTSRFPGSPDGVIPWTYAHFVDPFMALARASGATKRIKLGTAITLITERNPLILAKESATLDHFSGGRLILGIGTGWHKEETEIMGGDFDHRWTQAKEAVDVLKKLWTNDAVEHHGKYYDFPPIKSYPKPKQQPHPPILLGGMAPNVLKRVVAYADGWLPNRLTIDEVKQKRHELDVLAEGAGRDPSTLTITVHAPGFDPSLVKSYLKNGASRVTLRAPSVTSEKAAGQELEKFAKALL